MEKAGRAQLRLLLLFAVLAGLFLMHGMSAATGSGCHSGMPAMSAASATSMSSMSTPMATTAGAATQPHLAETMTSSETCVPLRPDEFGGLALALFAMVLGRICDPRTAPSIRTLPRWPHGPPRRGTDILNDLGVCRT